MLKLKFPKSGKKIFTAHAQPQKLPIIEWTAEDKWVKQIKTSSTLG